MNEIEKPEESPDETKHSLRENITGLGQKIIGEIEALAGVVNADPLAQAEGEFNVEVGGVRQELEGELEETDKKTGA